MLSIREGTAHQIHTYMCTMHRTVRYTATLKQTHCTVQENMGIKKPNNLVQAVSSNQYACIADTDSAVL